MVVMDNRALPANRSSLFRRYKVGLLFAKGVSVIDVELFKKIGTVFGGAGVSAEFLTYSERSIRIVR